MPATVTVESTALAGVPDAVAALVARAGDRGRHAVDAHRLGIATAGRDARQLLATVTDGGAVVAAALVTPEAGGWSLDLVVDPDRRGDVAVSEALVDAAAGAVADAGGGPVQAWIHRPTPADDRAAASIGWTGRRDLHQMRVALPLGSDAGDPAPTRPFEVGRDEDAWLAVNGAAFADHPDQGTWTFDDLAAREAEAWFDPSGFLLHQDDAGRVDGFCWTKVHDDARLGEIYGIGVHPTAAGRGLGRALCVAGLAHLARHCPTGMLYVDADNARAVAMYRGLGFTVDHTNRAYQGVVGAGT